MLSRTLGTSFYLSDIWTGITDGIQHTIAVAGFYSSSTFSGSSATRVYIIILPALGITSQSGPQRSRKAHIRLTAR